MARTAKIIRNVTLVVDDAEFKDPDDICAIIADNRFVNGTYYSVSDETQAKIEQAIESGATEVEI